MKKIAFYLARIFSILLVVFFALFILEGFSPGFGWQDAVSHLVATFLALTITVIAFHRPKTGSWLFIILGTLMFLSVLQSGRMIIGGVPVMIGLLFLIGE